MDINTSSIVNPASIIKERGIEFLKSMRGISNTIINQDPPVIVTRCEVPIGDKEKGYSIDLFILTEEDKSFLSLTSLRRFVEKLSSETSKNIAFIEVDDKKHYILSDLPGHKEVKELHDKIRYKVNNQTKAHFFEWESVTSCYILNDRLKNLDMGITSVLIIGILASFL